MGTALHFGGGKIGRGFMGQLYAESGFHTTFVDTDHGLIDSLNSHDEYAIHILEENASTYRVGNFEAIHASEDVPIVEAISEAAVVSTAAGAHALGAIAPILARGLLKRLAASPPLALNILVCENHADAAGLLRDSVLECIPSEYRDVFMSSVGFVNTSIGRMARDATSAERAEDSLALFAEAYSTLPIDGQALVKPFPSIRHVVPEENFRAVLDMKQFMHNAGHAVTAYLGYLRGHRYIWEAIADAKVREVVDEAMNDTAQAIAMEHKRSEADLVAHWEDLRTRFANRLLNDTVERVARDPIRKLGYNDRLIGAARFCWRNGIESKALCLAAASAMLYDHADDSEAQRLQTIREKQGAGRVLTEISGLSPEMPLYSAILESIRGLPTST